MKDDPADIGLPPLLTRADFDSDDEYQQYLDIEAGDLAPDDKTPEMLALWRRIGAAARNTSLAALLPEADLRALEARARREGVAADALAARVLHEWLESR
ncbi:hypothetical protein [Rubrimonas sp.]|uniref:hypothetical protein n=1 Tax=Rubrimonas sp. TaxID=2036015 RepID=UPI002FDE5885